LKIEQSQDGALDGGAFDATVSEQNIGVRKTILFLGPSEFLKKRGEISLLCDHIVLRLLERKCQEKGYRDLVVGVMPEGNGTWIGMADGILANAPLEFSSREVHLWI
jgi:hypothetical protein